MKVRKALLPLAGLGTRFLPWTKGLAKEMLPVVDVPSVQVVIEEALRSGIEFFVFVTSHRKTEIENYFDRDPELEMELERAGKEELLKIVREVSSKIEFVSVRQGEPRGLGHAVYMGKRILEGEPFAVLLPDDITYCEKKPVLKQMMEIAQKYDSSVVAVEEVPKEDVSKYGVVGGEKVEERVIRLRRLVEKPSAEEAPSNLAIVGRYILPGDIFETIEKTPPGRGGEIQLTDAMMIQVDSGKRYLAYRFEGIRYDTGNKLGYLKTVVDFALRDPRFQEEFRAYLRSKLL